MAEKLGEAVLELRTVGTEFNTGVDKAEGRAKQLGATLDMTAGSALELADKMAAAGREGGQSAQVWQRASASIDLLAQAQAQSKIEIDNARAALNAAKITQEEYNRTVLLSKAAVTQFEESHRQAQAELQKHIARTKEATGATGTQRQGLQQLGYQLGDVSTMYALGMRPAQIFASQISQTTAAIQLLAGETSKFAIFLRSGLGIALVLIVQLLGPLIGRLFETADAADETTKALDKMQFATSAVGDAQGILGNVMDLTTGKMKTQTQALIALARAQIAVAQIESRERQAKAGDTIAELTTKYGPNYNAAAARGELQQDRPLSRLQSELRSGQKSADDVVKSLQGMVATGQLSQGMFVDLAKAYANYGVETENQKIFEDARKLLDGTGGKNLLKPDTPDKKRDGKSQAEIEQAYQRDLASLNQEELQAKLSLATSAQERADIQYQMLADQRAQREAEINANKDYSEAQKKQLLAALDALYGKKSADGTILVSGGLLKDRIARDQIEAEKRLDAEMLSRQQQTLEAWARVAGSSKDRAALELQALQLQQQIERNLLEQQIATGQIADAAQARALLESRQAAEREGLRQANAGPLERYTDELRRNKLESGERVEELMVEELDYVHQSLTDTISSRLGVKDPFLRGLIDMFVEDVFIRPMAEALEQARGSAGGGGGGFFGSLLGSLFGGGGGASPLASLSSSAASTIADPAYAGLFATGGTIPAGSWGIAGEAGPEPVFAGAGGAVVMPNSTAGSRLSGGDQPIILFDFRDAVVTEELLRRADQNAQQIMTSGLSQYDSVVGDRVKEHLERRG
jgi:hypothetical protein